MDISLNIEDQDLPLVPPNPKKAGRPKGSTKKRMTDAEKRQFINESLKEILNNHLSYSQYVVYCREKMDLSKAQANEYWLTVWSLLKKKFELEKDKLILKHLQKYWNIYDQALISNDLTNARNTLNDIVKLQGLAEAEKVHITGTSIKLNFGNGEE